MRTADEIFDVLIRRGGKRYGGEELTQLEHALQSASLAEEADAQPSLIVASLLHDIGHLVHDLGRDAARQGIDDEHENRAVAALSGCFGDSVTEPIRLHVEAKRYLCATDPGYFSLLSRGSIISLNVQGGAHSPESARAFIQQPFADDAARLRRWDEGAKIKGRRTPDLEHFRPFVESLIRG
jgi:[1-hydroxy-2-(trimethylamino)ethyl]phosphonate dioxygenase